MKPLHESYVLPTTCLRMIYPSIGRGVMTADLAPVTLPDGRRVMGYYDEVDNLWIIQSRLIGEQWEFIELSDAGLS